MNSIKLININKIYGNNNSELYALKDINLTIKMGELIAIMGPSGSGKSTLLNIIGCMDTQTNGEYYLNNKLILNLSDKEMSKIRNNTISFVFQNFALIEDYDVFDNIELPLLRRKISKKDKNKLINLYANKLEINDILHKYPNQLSGGQQQRVAICRALVSDAQVILADEPTGALDSKTGQNILNILKDINKTGKTVIIVTHDEKIASYCDRIIFIKDGTVI